MNVETGFEAPRARPLSAGLWTLLSWLRREEHSSSDSLSSVGSDRTAVSFAFLAAPPRSRLSGLPSTPLSTSDTFTNRLREQNIHRHNDRDHLTLRTKYGLYRSDNGYDAFTLPSNQRKVNNNKENRERRAASETFERRAAYVPGKRRAPLPPTLIATLPIRRRASRKRPAPKPPVQIPEKLDESEEDKFDRPALMTSKTEQNNCNEPKSDKLNSTDSTPKDKKLGGKSFLKQIFEIKKRNSAIDPVPERILPNISELDKQAAAIIESRKLKVANQNVINGSPSNRNFWFCTKCLRKYDFSVISCENCTSMPKQTFDVRKKDRLNADTQTAQTTPTEIVASSSKIVGIDAEDKQKLKDMLKEMKHSLANKPKNGSIESITSRDVQDKNFPAFETSTLRIGANVLDDQKLNLQLTEPKNRERVEMHEPTEVVVSQPVVFQPVAPSKHPEKTVVARNSEADVSKETNSSKNSNVRSDNILHTPLKISSLLNPMYIPKHNVTENQVTRNTTNVKQGANAGAVANSINTSPIITAAEEKTQDAKLTSKNQIGDASQKVEPIKSYPTQIAISNNEIPSTSSNMNENVKFSVEQRYKRRDLINKLEQSIAKGDEQAAADAATKLAQLRLSCSVLSFSSQIAGEVPVTSNPNENKSSATSNQSNLISKQTCPSTKVNAAVQSMEIVTPAKLKTQSVKSPSKTPRTNGLIPLVPKTTSTQKLDENLRIEDKQKEVPMQNFNERSSSKETSNGNIRNFKTIEVWVEDREATRGPIRLRICGDATMGQLRRQAEATLGLNARLQRWIVGRALCTDDNTPLSALAGSDLTSPFYLCVVEADANATFSGRNKTEKEEQLNAANVGDVYSELVQLEKRALIVNTEPFECGVCMETYAGGRGAVLRECVHVFCNECLAELVRHCEEPLISCPAMGCAGALQEREIRALVTTDEYEKWLARGLAAAESGTRNAFHCRTRDCTGWALCDPGVRRFPCPVCKQTNCIPCQSIHEGETCQQFRAKQQAEQTPTISTDEGTEAFLETLISKGEALKCPECNAVITKKWGCDWVKCSACKTEICWVTRGRRWGPAGKGDTSGGCRCGVDGQRCHPSCGYCH